MSNDKKAPVKSIKLRFEKPAEYNGEVVYPKGEHEVPLERDGIKGWAQRWIARGAVDVESETSKSEAETKKLADKAAEAQKKADEAKEKSDKARAEEAAKKLQKQQTPPAPAGGQAPAVTPNPEDKKDGQDGQKSQASTVVENKQ